MGVEVGDILEAAKRLRRAQKTLLAEMPQAAIVDALVELACRWRDPAYPLRRQAEQWQEPFPFAMTQVSLDGLLDSMTPDALWSLVGAEGVREAFGCPLIGHVIAGNTPLLAWGSVFRALLMRSASLVKLPSGPAARWGHVLGESLADVCPPLAACVEWRQWPGGTTELDAALCRSVDLVLAYGSNHAMNRLERLCPADVTFLGYGHRVSFGLVLADGACEEAAQGFARDVLIFDQGGCLSPQTIFVEGGREECAAFAERLAQAMPQATADFPLPFRSPSSAPAVREACALARMEEDARLWEDAALRWTVIARPRPEFVLSPTFGVVSVQPLRSLDALPEALVPVDAFLQGCAVASSAPLPPEIAALGLSYVCRPGQLQAPPLNWRQDGRDVLRTLLPGGRQDHNRGL
ncbi:MAG: hypothetical protein M3Y13_13580 [Armatimonadota bacterium]|nr:hypothetical protein [Armatimonadota bacterium]